MPRPNVVEVEFYPIDNLGNRGKKQVIQVRDDRKRTVREIANSALEDFPFRTFLINTRRIYVGPIRGKAMSAMEFHNWRSRLNLSVNEAAHQLGISYRAVQYYEAGEREVTPSIKRLCHWIELGRKNGLSLSSDLLGPASQFGYGSRRTSA